jgi:hypothetical protein
MRKAAHIGDRGSGLTSFIPSGSVVVLQFGALQFIAQLGLFGGQSAGGSAPSANTSADPHAAKSRTVSVILTMIVFILIFSSITRLSIYRQPDSGMITLSMRVDELG